ncbi:hypothetical protein [Leisingera daeponensis]|uniref:hypothetical protein n=1 Tax=Leisingera daeponensis TaxID=405746 RepID=UPI001C9737A6|nr:hypothetical protein [Leisingera daeponensis]MBY6058783.1 hypothetical protein [Leisingera daeponensis]
MKISKKWIIRFDNGALLSEQKMKLTFFLTDAMRFDSRTAADFFLKAHSQEVSKIGLNPSIGELSTKETGLGREMYHAAH